MEPLPEAVRLVAYASEGGSCGSGSCSRPFLVVGAPDASREQVLAVLRDHLRSAKDWDFCDANAARLPGGRNGLLVPFQRQVWQASDDSAPAPSERRLSADDAVIAERSGVEVIVSTRGGGFKTCAAGE